MEYQVKHTNSPLQGDVPQNTLAHKVQESMDANGAIHVFTLATPAPTVMLTVEMLELHTIPILDLNIIQMNKINEFIALYD